MWIGLRAEIDFWVIGSVDFKLTMANDSGSHTDYVGVIDNENCRIDVTTNLDYKRLRDYQKFRIDVLLIHL